MLVLGLPSEPYAAAYLMQRLPAKRSETSLQIPVPYQLRSQQGAVAARRLCSEPLPHRCLHWQLPLLLPPAGTRNRHHRHCPVLSTINAY